MTDIGFRDYARTRDPGLRAALVEEYLPFARGLARRYARRGESLDDLEQVAAFGLVKAVERFDPERGIRFTSFAAPTIIGELKRHFRDRGWSVQVPRRLQELSLELGKLSSDLAQELGRSPTVSELAARVGADDEEVLEAMELGRTAYQSVSIDEPAGEQDTATLADRLAASEDAGETASNRASLARLLDCLPDRERRILHLRFFEDRTQSEIAEEIGISQMHVSRLIARSLDQLREISGRG